MKAFTFFSNFLFAVSVAVAQQKYVICDNDWSGSASFIPPLLYLQAGYEVWGRVTGRLMNRSLVSPLVLGILLWNKKFSMPFAFSSSEI